MTEERESHIRKQHLSSCIGESPTYCCLVNELLEALVAARSIASGTLDILEAEKTRAHEEYRIQNDAIVKLQDRVKWQKCKTHGDINLAQAWGCPLCVTELRTRVKELEEPFCKCQRSVTMRNECGDCGKQIGPA